MSLFVVICAVVLDTVESVLDKKRVDYFSFHARWTLTDYTNIFRGDVRYVDLNA